MIEEDIFNNNPGVEIAAEVVGDMAERLVQIFNKFPPPTDHSSDLSVFYTLDGRSFLWMLYDDDCLIGHTRIPRSVYRNLVVASQIGI